MTDATKVLVTALIFNLIISMAVVAYEDINNQRGLTEPRDFRPFTDSATSFAVGYTELTNEEGLGQTQGTNLIQDDTYGSGTSWGFKITNLISNMVGIAPIQDLLKKQQGDRVEVLLMKLLATLRMLISSIVYISAYRLIKNKA